MLLTGRTLCFRYQAWYTRQGTVPRIVWTWGALIGYVACSVVVGPRCTEVGTVICWGTIVPLRTRFYNKTDEKRWSQISITWEIHEWTILVCRVTVDHPWCTKTWFSVFVCSWETINHPLHIMGMQSILEILFSWLKKVLLFCKGSIVPLTNDF